MKVNLHQNLIIEWVVSHFGFSVRSLPSLFISSSIRFVHYLNYQYVVRVIEVQTDGALNIEQITYDIDLNLPNSFSWVFK